MRIALICGSIRKDSFSKKVLNKIAESYSEIKTEVDLELDIIDFSLEPLPVFDGSLENYQLAETFIERISLAEGIVIACPEYHNSFSGVLKNAFDYLNCKYIEGKPVSLIATSGGGKGGINCLNSMRLFLRGLYALVLPEQLVIDRNETLDPVCLEKATHLINNVIKYSLFNRKESQLYSTV